MRFLLDTNIISNATKPAPSEALLTWMAEQTDQDVPDGRRDSPWRAGEARGQAPRSA
jgi:predicted nucleic acid-binding protein